MRFEKWVALWLLGPREIQRFHLFPYLFFCSGAGRSRTSQHKQQRARSIIHAIILASSNLCYRARVVNSSLRVCYCVQEREIPFLFIFLIHKRKTINFTLPLCLVPARCCCFLKIRARKQKEKNMPSV